MPRQDDIPMDETTTVGQARNPYQQQEDGESMTSQASQTAQDTAQTVRESAGQYAEQGRERVESQLSEQKMRISQELGSFSEAIRTAGQQLHEQNRESVANFIDQGADQVDQVARYLQDRDVSEIVGEVESFARQRPAIFLGGAFGLGLIAARFIKSSGQQARTPRY